MHKRYVNHCTITLTMIPDGPILIKSGKEGADPTKPNMEFVETLHAGGKTVYLPGSSLKGAIRAHAERIVRTVGGYERPTSPGKLWASDPLSSDRKNNPNHYLNEIKEQNKASDTLGAKLYKDSCFITQLFGSTGVASRVRIEDGYPDPTSLRLEERNGVAIDRVFGSVAVGPFNYQVCTAGEFRTRIHLKNFTLAQLGLIALVLRDLDEGWFGIGFAKSRGMGSVKVRLEQAVVQYPGCVVKERIEVLGSDRSWPKGSLLGVGEFLKDEEAKQYGFPKPDKQDIPIAASPMNLGLGAQMVWQGGDETGVPNLFLAAVRSWSQELQHGAKAS